MDLKQLLSEKQAILYQQYVDGGLLVVKETEHYRWFEYGNVSVQSLMSLASSEKILLPVYQSLLLFLLWNNKPLKVLNLGLGGASVERALAVVPNVSLTSVDASQAVIDMAKRYFNLPQNVDVVCQKAEQFVAQTNEQYNVVLCDLFVGSSSPKFLQTQDFYAQLSKVTLADATVIINLQADTDEQLLHALVSVKKYFPYTAIIEFDDYSNIVIIASLHEIPDKTLLQKRLMEFNFLELDCLEHVIGKMRYIRRSNN